MNVLFVSDFGLHHNIGGAQQSNAIIMAKGEELGHRVVPFYVDTQASVLIHKFDVLISSNLQFFAMHRADVFGYITNHPKHVRLEHDMNLYLSAPSRQALFASAKANVFLSDFHIQSFKEAYGDLFNNMHVVYDPIDINLFCKEEDRPKKYDIVYCGFLHQLKGFVNLLIAAKEQPERRFDVFGWSEDAIDELKGVPENVTIHPSVSQEEVAEILKSCNAVYHAPLIAEPFCRMVAEGLLCGTEVLGYPEMIGSYLEYKKVGEKEFARKCASAAEDFWKVVEASV
jgi:glycosyltransferase involved in cell wall biosynthesis